MMFPGGCLWTLLTLSISIMGSPVEVRNSHITLAMTTRVHFSNDTNPVQRDDAQRITIPLENVHTVSWVPIGVGSPPTFYRLVVNTGSAITWIDAVADTVSRPTGTATNTELQMEIIYFDTYFAGILLTDTLCIATPNARYTIDEMPIGVTTPLTWGMPYDGMLGIGPQILSRGTILTDPDRTFPTVTERLFTQGSISLPLVGLFFKPSTRDILDDDHGTLVFGDGGPGDIIRYTYLSRRPSVLSYWGINQAITYDDEQILRRTAGIVDSGTTFIWIASDAYDRYQTATGANLDPNNGMLYITLEQYHALQPLEFHIGGQIYNLCPNAQIWPRWLNDRIGGAPNGIYLVIRSLSRATGTSGIDFRLGYVFLQRFYCVYDGRNLRIGFATTPYTDADTN
ncbi:hypothetical protein BDR07DRAFT_1358469 [Suillus spraguei]|nr:hypothetical protein BDR07DRAFT_1358469 [Suillus spraguei]